MNSGGTAQAAWILSLVTSPRRAAETAGRLAAGNSLRAWPVARAAISLVIGTLRNEPFRIAAFVATAYVLMRLLGYAMIAGSDWLIRRPYDDSLLSSFWIRQPATWLSQDWASRGVVVVFLTGLMVAFISRERAVAVVLAVLACQLAIGLTLKAADGRLQFPGTSILIVRTILFDLPLFLAAILVRLAAVVNASWHRV